MVLRYPVSSTQECRLRLHRWARAEKERLFHLNDTIAWRFRGDFDPAAMELAVQQVCRRHDTMTATYHIEGDDTPYQILRPEVVPTLARTNLENRRGGSADEAVEAARQLLTAESHEHRPLHQAPQVQGRIVRLSETDHIFTFQHPSLMMDHWGYEVFVRDLAAYYNAAMRNETADLEPCLPFSQYAELDYQSRHDGTWDDSIGYWRDHYRGEVPLPILPIPGRDDPSVGRIEGAILGGEFEPASVAALRQAWSDLSNEAITPYAFMVSVMVSLFSGRLELDDVGLLVPAANRTDWAYHDTVGAFATILSPRFRSVRRRSFVDLCRHVQETLLDSLEHQHVSYHEMMRRLDPSRYGASLRDPFCYVDYVVEDSPTEPTTFHGLEPEPFALAPLPTEQEGLAMVFFDEGGPTIRYSLSYAKRLFTAEQAQRFAREVETVAVNAAAALHGDVSVIVDKALHDQGGAPAPKQG